MAHGSEIIRVCRLENGFEVEVYEPAPRKKDKTKKDSCCAPTLYDDPWKAYAFETEEAALTFIAGKLPGLSRKTPDQEMEDAFNEATN